MRLLDWAFGRRRTRPRPAPPLAGESHRFRSRYRVGLGLPVVLACGWQAQPTSRSLAAGGAIAFLGVLVRALAAGQLHKHHGLSTSGVYAVTRHPLYLGSAVMAAGFSLAMNSWQGASLLACYLVVFYPATMRREEQRLRSRYAGDFDDYVARVPCFWPRLAWPPGTTFSWALYFHNAEYQAALGFFAGVALLWLKLYGGA